MEINTLWQQFVSSGKIDDYLCYVNSSKGQEIEHKTKRNSAKREYNPRKR